MGNMVYCDTESDWNAFVTGYEAGLKKYGIKDYVHLSPKNIDIMLGFLNGDIDSGEE